MRIGSVFDQTSTTEFVVMLDRQYDNERLLFSYIELSSDGGQPQSNAERIVARITNVYKENPLLSRDQASIAASVDLSGLGFEYSRRFTYGWAKCTVIGALINGRLGMNQRSISPSAEIYTPSPETLGQLFFNPSPAYLPVGAIETFSTRNSIDEVPITLNADQMVTKHFCVFGMTGSGKTNTSAKLLEELMARGHRMVVFDSHDDYRNIETFSNLFKDFDENGQLIELATPPTIDQAVQYAITQLNITASDGRQLEDCVRERLLRSASVIFNNTPARSVLRANQHHGYQLSEEFVTQLSKSEPWKRLIENPQVLSYQAFPELKSYGANFQDFSISLLAAVQGEEFSAAQWRSLRERIDQPGVGIDYLQNLYRATRNIADDRTRNVLQQRINGLQAIYRDAQASGAQPLDFADFFRQVCDRYNSFPQTFYRLSLTNLSSNLRKAMVYGVTTFFFRSFKFGGYQATNTQQQASNAHPVLFVLEEARSLIPRSSGNSESDISGSLARRAMRELAYEGRKFSIGFGIISQKPSTIDPEVVSQSNTFILHQLKSPDDQQYVRSVTESMSQEELDMIKSLGTGRAIVAGVAVQSPVLLKVYFRYSEEGIREPAPISDSLSTINQIKEQLSIL